MLETLSGVARQSSVAVMAFGELLDRWMESSEPPRYTGSDESLAARVIAFAEHSERPTYAGQ